MGSNLFLNIGTEVSNFIYIFSYSDGLISTCYGTMPTEYDTGSALLVYKKTLCQTIKGHYGKS